MNSARAPSCPSVVQLGWDECFLGHWYQPTKRRCLSMTQEIGSFSYISPSPPPHATLSAVLFEHPSHCAQEHGSRGSALSSLSTTPPSSPLPLKVTVEIQGPEKVPGNLETWASVGSLVRNTIPGPMPALRDGICIFNRMTRWLGCREFDGVCP